MGLAPDILPRTVVDCFMVQAVEHGGQGSIHPRLIGVHGRPWGRPVFYERNERRRVGPVNLLRGDVTYGPRAHTRHGHLTHISPARVLFPPFVFVPLPASQIRLIDLDRPRQRPGRVTGLLRRLPQPAQDKPGRLLRHADLSGQLVAADALPARGHEERRHKPLLQRQAAFLVDRALTDAELLLAVATLVDAGPTRIAVNLAAAGTQGAGDAVRPA